MPILKVKIASLNPESRCISVDIKQYIGEVLINSIIVPCEPMNQWQDVEVTHTGDYAIFEHYGKDINGDKLAEPNTKTGIYPIIFGLDKESEISSRCCGGGRKIINKEYYTLYWKL